MREYAQPAPGLVHGLFRAYTGDGRDIECNAYCRDGEHCDLAYFSDDMDADAVLWSCRLDLQRPSVEVTRVVAATEAPPVDPEVYLRGTVEPDKGWLVFWRKR